MSFDELLVHDDAAPHRTKKAVVTRPPDMRRYYKWLRQQKHQQSGVRTMNNKSDGKIARELVKQVANELGLEKVMWSRAVKAAKECLENGFTVKDIMDATAAMKAGDKKYWSIYSIFTKPDYWMSKQQPKTEAKGVW